MGTFRNPPLSPFPLDIDLAAGTLSPKGPTLVRRMRDLEGCFADENAWRTAVDDGDPVVYEVVSSPVPEQPRELPQSITKINPGDTGGEFWMTKGHQHPDPQGEIYLGLIGRGGLLMYDGTTAAYLQMGPGVIGYIPPGWAHRSINVGDEPYSFLAVYPGSAGHDYGWVLEHGLGHRVLRDGNGYRLRDYHAATAAAPK
jgi:glucose-6-phosphate isomerase